MKYRVSSEERDLQHPEDLSVLERRGLLSDAGRRRLQMALAASDTLRCSHQLGRDFDDLQTIGDSDAVLFERLVERTRHRYARPNLGRTSFAARRALPWLGVAALLMVSAAAGATLWPYARRLVISVPDLAPSVLQQVDVGTQRKGRMRANQAVETNDDRRSEPAEPGEPAVPVEGVVSSCCNADGPKAADRTPRAADQTPKAVGESPRAGSSVAAPNALQTVSTARFNPEGATGSEPPEAASVLFGDANAARRRGDIGRARVLYARLAALYPAANETALSYVLLARIDLQNGGASAALRQFDQYLLVAPSGPLAEEAIEGKAEAYRQMGMPAEETFAWRELLRRYPNSVYGKAARKRLGELQ
jgi:hypothetical protein